MGFRVWICGIGRSRGRLNCAIAKAPFYVGLVEMVLDAKTMGGSCRGDQNGDRPTTEFSPWLKWQHPFACKARSTGLRAEPNQATKQPSNQATNQPINQPNLILLCSVLGRYPGKIQNISLFAESTKPVPGGLGYPQALTAWFHLGPWWLNGS